MHAMLPAWILQTLTSRPIPTHTSRHMCPDGQRAPECSARRWSARRRAAATDDDEEPEPVPWTAARGQAHPPGLEWARVPDCRCWVGRRSWQQVQRNHVRIKGRYIIYTCTRMSCGGRPSADRGSDALCVPEGFMFSLGLVYFHPKSQKILRFSVTSNF